MKKMYTLLLSLLAFSGFGQTQQVTLHMKQLLDNQPFALGTAANLPASAIQHKVSRLQYYLSEITVLHDGGQATLIPDLHLLIDPSKDSVFVLGQVAATTVEGIRFGIGVDQANNHLDPAKWPAGHPLAPKNPDMNWGWAAGYRFIALEGDAANASGVFSKHYELHALGDNNYKTVQIASAGQPEIDGIHVRLKADYSALLNLIDVTNGLVAHGTGGVNITMMKNAQTSVFSSEIAAQTIDFQPVVSLVVGPNPAVSELRFKYDFNVKTAVALTVLDNSGKQIFYADKLATDGDYVLPTSAWSGHFVYQFSTAGKLIAAGSFQVIR